MVVNAIHHFYIDHNALRIPPPPKVYMTIVPNFSWVLQSSQEKSKTTVMKNLGGGNRVRDGPCENGKEKLFQRSYIKTEFRSQRIETFLFLITNMAAKTSRVNQKLYVVRI